MRLTMAKGSEATVRSGFEMLYSTTRQRFSNDKIEAMVY